jgi:Protein of unknown function (DUF429)
MITAGVDLASQDNNTSSCLIHWDGGGARVEDITQKVGDDQIRRLISHSTKVGIDAPFGWPIAFAEAVFGHSTSGGWPATYQHKNNENKAYRFRQTDLWVKKYAASTPLSVSTDRIAYPAMRIAALLAQLPEPVARDGSGVAVEAYPAAALLRWNLPHRKYKGSKYPQERAALIALFVDQTKSWLEISPANLALCLKSDDAFDALIAALIARAAAVGLVDPIPLECRDAALREGWIAIPTIGSLDRLAQMDSQLGR